MFSKLHIFLTNMFGVFGLPLLFVVFMTSRAFALVVTSAPAPDWDKIVKESLVSRAPGREHFSVLKTSCSCPSGWLIYNRRCFKYVELSLAWFNAEEHCLNLNANLVSIHSEDEYQLIKALIRNHDQKENPTWIGLSDCQEQNKWVWSDGTKLGYTNWNPDEPNFSKGECCVHMNFSDQKNWNDIPCSLKYPFICSKNLA